MDAPKNTILAGSLFAATAALIWSGNFIVARGIAKEIPPFSLSFYRWVIGTLIIAPFAFSQLKQEMTVVKKNWLYIFCTGLTGIALFNTCLYVAGHFSEAINLALLGTATSPVISVVLARVFLKEKITPLRITGLLVCIAGILFLLSKGSLATLLSFKFSTGDKWILLAALSFAIYNTLVRKKPAGISPVPFLFVVFLAGTLLLLPFFLWEHNTQPPVQWNPHLLWILLYIGLGASVLSFLFWNKAVASLGAARTALFGYLIPVFSSIEAVWLLNETITWIHFVCGGLVIGGLVIANLDSFRKRVV
ncbi:MAG: DMT family transporter [Chitinophagaceae bacterium]